jgi:hypothetical protein
MRSKLSTEFFSREYAIGFVVLFALALLIVAIFRHRRWAAFLWMPTLCWSGILSCVALLLLLFGLNPPSGQGGGMPGQFVLAAALVVAPFAAVFCAALFVRPGSETFTRSSISLSLLLTVCLSATPFVLPRPNLMSVQIRVLDSSHAPVQNAIVTYSAFGGKGANYDGEGRTDAAGRFILPTYPFEWGQIAISAPTGETTLRYEYWPEIMTGGKHNGVRLTAPGDASRLEAGVGYVIGKTIAANSNEFYDVLLQSH